jgi:uncharacterized protein with von Willebrand factor type A (vWA) domain
MVAPGPPHPPGTLRRSDTGLAEQARNLFELLRRAGGEVLSAELVDVAVADQGQTPRGFAVTRRGIDGVLAILAERVIR